MHICPDEIAVIANATNFTVYARYAWSRACFCVACIARLWRRS